MRINTYPSLSTIGESARNINPIYFNYPETMRVINNLSNHEFIRVNSIVYNFSSFLEHALNRLSLDPDSLQGNGFINFLEAQGYGPTFLYERLGHYPPI
jgi:hypothetical protein